MRGMGNTWTCSIRSPAQITFLLPSLGPYPRITALPTPNQALSPPLHGMILTWRDSPITIGYQVLAGQQNHQPGLSHPRLHPLPAVQKPGQGVLHTIQAASSWLETSSLPSEEING